MVSKSRAVFLDRDGVVNDLVYHEEEGRVLSPFSARELRVFPYVAQTVRTLKDDLGFKVVVISNQPGVGKRQFTYRELQRMNQKVRRALAAGGASFDGEYYCLHHPNALIQRYRTDCDCRKPKPGMLLKAAEDHGIDLGDSFFVGDSLIDVKAGKGAGCKTVLVGHASTMLTTLMEREGVNPDFMLGSLKDLPTILGPTKARQRRDGAGRRSGSASTSSPWTLCG